MSKSIRSTSKSSSKPKIYLGTDHAGFLLKEKIKVWLKEWNYDFKDFGTNSTESCDYPDFIFPVAKKVARENANGKEKARGIILGGSGQGEAITANRIKGVRAVVYYGYNKEIIELSRIHNNANVLSLGARFVNEKKAKEAVKLWLETEFTKEERHVKRIKKIDESIHEPMDE